MISLVMSSRRAPLEAKSCDEAFIYLLTPVTHWAAAGLMKLTSGE